MPNDIARYGTPFVETEALLASVEGDEGDEDYLQEVLAQMTEQQRIALRQACNHLSARIRQFIPSA